MLTIVPSWADAKFGALGNLIALVGVIFGFLGQGPAERRTTATSSAVSRASRQWSRSPTWTSHICLP